MQRNRFVWPRIASQCMLAVSDSVHSKTQETGTGVFVPMHLCVLVAAPLASPILGPAIFFLERWFTYSFVSDLFGYCVRWVHVMRCHVMSPLLYLLLDCRLRLYLFQHNFYLCYLSGLCARGGRLTGLQGLGSMIPDSHANR
jgi:hypothetical protein